MKLFKKAAALFFCLALALSVMAVTALADDEAELLSGADGVTTVTNSDFKVALIRSPKNNNSDPKINDDILDRDSVYGYEINYNQKVSFDIYMAYKQSAGTNFGASFTIDGFQFDFKPANNYGATIDSVVIFKDGDDTSGTAITHPTNGSGTLSYFRDENANYENTYAFSSLGADTNDIQKPAEGDLTFTYDATDANGATERVAGGTKIGRITLNFNGATQAVNIYPQIERLLIHVRNTETLQRPVAATKGNDYSYTNYGSGKPSDTAGVLEGGKAPQSGDKVAKPAQNDVYTDCVIVAPVPVIVNPVYTVTLEKFAPNDKSGIIAKVENGDNKTDTLMYDFTKGSFQTNSSYDDGSGHATVLTNGTHNVFAATSPTMPGYTLQGWMVTKNAQTSSTWKAYDGMKDASTDFSPKWDMKTSYPATTTAMQVPNSDCSALTTLNHWYIDESTKTQLDEWYQSGKVVFDIGVENSYTTNTAGNYLNTAKNVNFIPAYKGTTTDPYQLEVGSTFFPAGMVGNITLTPVYTRDVYTATFVSGDDDAAFDATVALNATGTKPYAPARETEGNDATPYKYSRNYTIEDLWDVAKETDDTANNEIVDFLYLNDSNQTTTGDNYWKGPQGLERKAYKFMGWSLSDNSDTNTAPVAAAAYKWARTTSGSVTDDRVAVSSYNDGKVLKEATAKHYGDVTFTAVWEEDIYYSEIGYQYAGANNAMILVAVPKDNYDANYTYTYKVGGTAQPMFIIPEGKTENNAEVGQRANYLKAALEATTGEFSGEYAEKITAAKTTGETKGYVMFAYIAAAEAEVVATPNDCANIANVEIDEAETYKTTISNPANGALAAGVPGTTCANYQLLYDGDVDGNRAINVGDFGNVDSLFVDANAEGANTVEVFKVTGSDGWYGVRARLEADVYATGDKAENKFASIADIKAIYNLMGYNKE